MTAVKPPGKLIDLRTVRGRRFDAAAAARDRFARSRQAAGLSPAAFANVLMEILGWSVAPEAITSWESTGAPPGDVLLAAEFVAQPHVDATQGLMTATGARMRIVDNYAEVQAELAAVIDQATEILGVTGSRSRDPDYLTRIEAAVTSQPGLVHYRILYGPPRHGALKNHLLRLVDLHRPEGTVNVGIFWDLLKDSERFLCVSEQAAIIVLPSLKSISNFDTALVIDDPEIANNYVTHIRQAYLGSQALTTRTSVEDLEVLR